VSPRRTRGYLPATRAERSSYRAEAWPIGFLAFGLLQSGIAALLNPTAASATSVAMLLHGDWSVFETLWQASYVLAAVLLFVGILIPYPLAEVLGEWIAMWALAINLVALLIVRGFAGTGASYGAFLIALSVCAVRIMVIHRRAADADVDRRERSEPYPGPERRR
jgi:hypothetical protein